MNAILKITCASLALAGLASGGPSWATEPERDFAVGVNEANAKLRSGDVDGALQQYADVRTLAPESADLSYNMAVAQYRKGDVAAAEPLFQSAATSENDSLAAKARYNLGNCNYASGLELAEKDKPAAIEKLESAISNYRSALDVDSSNGDARANIELAAQLIEKLREEQKQQEQQQNQQQDQQNDKQQEQNQNQQSKDEQQQDQQKQDQQQQDQQTQDSQSQSSEGGEKQDQRQDQQSGDEQKKENEKQQEQQSQDQQAQDEKSKQDQQSQEQQDSSKQNEQQSESQGQPQDAQSKQQQEKSQSPQHSQQDKSQQPRPQDEASAADEAKEKKDQQPPQGELTAASEQEGKDGKEMQQVAAFDPTKDGEMTQQEAEKMLQAIRDRDMIRRYRHQQEELQRHVPVDRDW